MITRYYFDPNRNAPLYGWCSTNDVAALEAKHAKLEAVATQMAGTLEELMKKQGKDYISDKIKIILSAYREVVKNG